MQKEASLLSRVRNVIEIQTKMKLKISYTSSISIYQHITDRLIDCIEKGILKPGDKLPSIGKMSLNNVVAKKTIVRAYAKLKQLYYVESVGRKGFYVSSKKVNSSANKQGD